MRGSRVPRHGGWGGDYDAIHDAVSAAPSGATIRVCPGVIVEPTLAVVRDLAIVGAGAAQTIIVSDGTGELRESWGAH